MHKSDQPHIELPVKVGRQAVAPDDTIATHVVALCPWLSRAIAVADVLSHR